MSVLEIMAKRFNLPVPGILRTKNGSIWVTPINVEAMVPGLLPIRAISCHGCDLITNNLSPSQCFGNFVPNVKA